MTKPLVTLDNVDVALDGQLVLRAISWSLLPGENWAVLGRNGSGKSTLLRLIRGELWPAPHSRGRRLYAFNGDEQSTAVGTRELIALVSPELQTRYLQQDWALTAAQVIHSGFHGGHFAYERLVPAQQDAAVAAVRLLGIEELVPRNVQTLSTGELRKVLIARALVRPPRVLVCDEICDGLDHVSRLDLLHTLQQLSRSGIQLLYTTHREEELFPALTHRLRLEQGRIVESGPIPRRRATGRTAGDTPSLPSPASPALRQPAARNGGRVLIRIVDADVFLGRTPALSRINLEIRSGAHWGIVGPNGSGKSTLLKLVHGDLHPAWGGRVQRFEFTARNSIWDIKRRIGFVSPELQAAYREPISGQDAVASGLFASVGLRRKLTRRQRRAVSRLLVQLGLQTLGARSILRMSYGEFRQILIARALVRNPDLLLCDEPFDGLDAPARRAVSHTLEAAARRGATLVVVTHHAGDLPLCTTHLAELDGGRIIRQLPFQRRSGSLRKSPTSSAAVL